MGKNAPFHVVSLYVAICRHIIPPWNEDILCVGLNTVVFTGFFAGQTRLLGAGRAQNRIRGGRSRFDSGQYQKVFSFPKVHTFHFYMLYMNSYIRFWMRIERDSPINYRSDKVSKKNILSQHSFSACLTVFEIKLWMERNEQTKESTRIIQLNTLFINWSLLRAGTVM